jgi:hypothetical protein
MLHEKLRPLDQFPAQFLGIVADKVRHGGVADREMQEALSHVIAIDVIARVLRKHVLEENYDPIAEIQRRVPKESIANEINLAIQYGYNMLGSEFRNYVIDELNES